MSTIQGLTRVLEPNAPERVNERGKKTEKKSGAPLKDGVAISSEAQKAQAAAQLVEMVKQDDSGVRAERVAEAKEQIEQGTYKLGEIVLQVAARVANYL